MKLFTIVNGDIVINKVELLTIPEFKTILKRTKHNETPAKKRDRVFSELAYIYHIADSKSLPNTKGYDLKEANFYAIEKAGLDKDWKPDEVILEAIEIYKEENSSIAKDTINELLKTFRFTNKVIIKVRVSIEEILDTEKLSKEQAAEVLGLIETSIKFGRDIPKLSRELNGAINELFEDENDDVVLLRGSKEPVPMSADPDTDF